MSVGGLATFDGPAPTLEELRAHVGRRLDLIPRYRQRLKFPPLHSGRPLWADDQAFDIDYHVRRRVLEPPGGSRELWALHAEIFAARLHRDRPLWELYLVDGLRGGRFAIIAKNHHALTDGVSNIDVLDVLWDLSADAPDRPGAGADGWRPATPPSAAEVLGAGVRELIGGPLGLARAGASLAAHPVGTAERLVRGTQGVLEIARAIATPAPRTPLNVRIGPRRSFRTVHTDLADFKRVKDAFGATVNDVMLTVVAEGVGAVLRSVGEEADALVLRPVVPVSIRRPDERTQLGNRVVTMRPALPVDGHDAVARLKLVHREMTRLKGSTQPTVVEVLENIMNWAPPLALGPVARIGFHPRLFSLLISNIPGPQFPLYLRGRRAADMVACGFLAEEQALAVAAVSYDGQLGFGLLADPDVVPDLDVMADAIVRSLGELVAAASDHNPKRAR